MHTSAYKGRLQQRCADPGMLGPRPPYKPWSQCSITKAGRVSAVYRATGEIQDPNYRNPSTFSPARYQVHLFRPSMSQNPPGSHWRNL